MRRLLALGLLGLLVIVAQPSLADRCTRGLRRLEGWTIVSVTQVEGEFEGCDFDRVIKLMDGSTFRCSTYGYTYSYSPDAIVFAKKASLEGQSFLMIKVFIEGEIYDMAPISEK